MDSRAGGSFQRLAEARTRVSQDFEWTPAFAGVTDF
jgi:hypothetical protein